ncbi:uncharacterized protein ARMOST_11866 [Armillaria ostoyae]|uniref:Uncharacterized protein n=1 Tax=Armillaria ostoyae TaxID=47428 RepID=A0A284RID2_ARMOS|nr:uncharacterized protein ARMOST_11866 [Armillaria ostoyae]
MTPVSPTESFRRAVTRKSALDRWLSHSIEDDSRSSIDDDAASSKYVLCTVKRVHETYFEVGAPACDVWTLYLTASAPQLLDSPRAILDMHVTKPYNATPGWVKWPDDTVVFRQDRVRFAFLFGRIGSWYLNRSISVHIEHWVDVLTRDTWIEEVWDLEYWGEIQHRQFFEVKRLDGIDDLTSEMSYLSLE